MCLEIELRALITGLRDQVAERRGGCRFLRSVELRSFMTGLYGRSRGQVAERREKK